MAYVIRYLTTVTDAPCSITLRGLFENGRYYGDVVIRNNFNFNIEGKFNENDISDIYRLISHLVSSDQIESESSVDFWICQHPIASQVLLFKHYTYYTYDEEFKKIFAQLVCKLEKEINPSIQKSIQSREEI